MYAVIETGGKQYRVELGTELEVERLEVEAGSAITLDRVLLVADGDTAAIGRPLVAGASVAAEVLRQDRGEKVISFKYRPKARRRVKKGHRQELTVLRISDIVLDGRSAAADAAKAAEARITERQRLEAAARRQAEADAAIAEQLRAAKSEATTSAAGPATSSSKPARAGRTAKTTEPSSTPKAKAQGKAEAPSGRAKDTDADAGAGSSRRSRTTKKDE